MTTPTTLETRRVPRPSWQRGLRGPVIGRAPDNPRVNTPTATGCHGNPRTENSSFPIAKGT
jgi:hypothetical protein